MKISHRGRFLTKTDRVQYFLVMITLFQMSKFTGDVFGTTLRGLAAIQPVQGGSGSGGGGAQEQDADRDRERAEGQGVMQAMEYFNDKLLEQKTRHREQVLSQLKMKYDKKPATVRAVTFTKKLSFGFEDVLELLGRMGKESLQSLITWRRLTMQFTRLGILSPV